MLAFHEKSTPYCKPDVSQPQEPVRGLQRQNHRQEWRKGWDTQEGLEPHIWPACACSFSPLVKHWLLISESHLLSTHLLCQPSEEPALENKCLPCQSLCLLSSLVTLSLPRSTFVPAPSSPERKSLLCLPWNWEK